MRPEYSSQSFGSGLAIQLRVVGALILREIHTRFGRHNIGFLWMIVEPMLLALGITISHTLGVRLPLPYGMNPVQFWVAGYTPWIMFRQIILRSDTAIEANRTLLYHRVVTILDIQIARAVLEFLGTSFALVLMLVGSAALGFGSLPQNPLGVIVGLCLLWWLAFGLSLIVCAACEVSHVAEKMIHPTIYLLLPFSGVFYLINWIPSSYRDYVLYVPIPQLLEYIRQGVFGDNFQSPFVNLSYVTACCIAVNWVGLVVVKRVRKNVLLT